MQYHCRLGADGYFVAFEVVDALFVDDSFTADDGPCVVGDVDGAGALVGIEHDDDVFPFVVAGKVFQSEGYEAGLCGQELEVLLYECGVSHAEGWMMASQVDEVAVVVEHLRIALEVLPVELVDAVG